MKLSGTTRKRAGGLAAGICAIALAATGLTVAYLTDTDVAVNDFELNTNLSVKVNEPKWDENLAGADAMKVLPTQNVVKDPTLLNDGTVAEWVFATIEVPTYTGNVADAEGHVSSEEGIPAFSFDVLDGWKQLAEPVSIDGKLVYTYGYQTILDPEDTAPLFDSVTTVNYLKDVPLDAAQVVINGYGIQAGSFATVDEAFAAYSGQNGDVVDIYQSATELAVNVDMGGGTIAEDAIPSTITSGEEDSFTLPVSGMEREGYEFAGWTWTTTSSTGDAVTHEAAADGTGDITVTAPLGTKTVDVVAKWDAIPYYYKQMTPSGDRFLSGGWRTFDSGTVELLGYEVDDSVVGWSYIQGSQTVDYAKGASASCADFFSGQPYTIETIDGKSARVVCIYAVAASDNGIWSARYGDDVIMGEASAIPSKLNGVGVSTIKTGLQDGGRIVDDGADTVETMRVIENVKPGSTRDWFNSMSLIEDIDGLSKVDTSDVSDMAYMFNDAASLLCDSSTGEGIGDDFASLDLASLTNMDRMFNNAASIKNVDMTGLVGHRMTDRWGSHSLDGTFAQCTSLERVSFPDQVGVFDTNRPMYTFSGCTSLKEIDLSFFRFHNAYSGYIFTNCASLETVHGFIQLPESAAGYETDIYGHPSINLGNIFQGCTSLKNVDLSSLKGGIAANFSLGEAFEDCESLEHVDLSGIPGKYQTGFNEMFKGCKSLKTVDFSGWGKLEQLPNYHIGYVFSGCSNLETIYADATFDLGSITRSPIEMFEGCDKLVGGNGFAYATADPENRDMSFYAHVDGVQSADSADEAFSNGYFTTK